MVTFCPGFTLPSWFSRMSAEIQRRPLSRKLSSGWPGADILADGEPQVGDDPVGRRTDLGIAQVKAGLIQCGQRLADLRIAQARLAQVGRAFSGPPGRPSGPPRILATSARARMPCVSASALLAD